MSQDALVAVLVKPAHQKEMETFRADAVGLAEILSFPCDTAKDEETLNEILSFVQGKITHIESMRTEITQPMNTAKRSIDKLFKALSAPYDAAKSSIKEKLAGAENKRRELRALAWKEAEVLSLQGDTKGMEIALSRVFPTQVASAGVQYRYQWTFEVENLAEVPREFLTVNPDRIAVHLAAFSKSEHADPIPGLKFTRVATVVAR